MSFKSLPWVGIIVGSAWGFYNLIRKKIAIDTDIGLLIESLFILPFALVAFYFISKNNLNDFTFANPFNAANFICRSNDCYSFIFICKRC